MGFITAIEDNLGWKLGPGLWGVAVTGLSMLLWEDCGRHLELWVESSEFSVLPWLDEHTESSAHGGDLASEVRAPWGAWPVKGELGTWWGVWRERRAWNVKGDLAWEVFLIP